MNLLTTSFWSAVATILKICTGFVVNKILAVYVGPSGVAILGQFSNYIGMITTFGNGGINAGVTKYIAQHGKDSSQQREVAHTALKIAFNFSLMFGIINFIFANFLSGALFHTEQYESVFQAFAILLMFISINTTLLSILNGYKEIKLYLAIGVVNSLSGLIMTYALVSQYTIYGALFSIILTQSIVCIITMIYVRRFEWFDFSFITASYNKKIVKDLSGYTLMALTSACVVPVSQILVRNYLAEQLSLDDAGYWQAVWKISEVYLMIITTSLSTYYLPRLSEITDSIELKKEILRGYKILLPITIFMAIAIYSLREYIILILFTPKFMLMNELFLFQLIGDILKICSWLLAFLMLAKAMTRIYIITEVIFGFSFVGLVYIFVGQFGLVGVTYAHVINYLLYFLVMVWIMRRKLCMI